MRLLTIVILAGVIAGCSTSYNGPSPRQAAGDPPLQFALGTLDIVDETGGAAPDPDLVDAFAETPRQSMRRWASERLAVKPGVPGVLRFRILQATATRTELRPTPGVRGWFSRDQVEKVAVSLNGHLEARRNDGSLISVASARAEGYQTFGEGLEAEKRREGLDELLRTVLRDFSDQMDQAILTNMQDVR